MYPLCYVTLGNGICIGNRFRSRHKNAVVASPAIQLRGVEAMESISIFMLVSMVAVVGLIDVSDGITRAENSESCWLLE